MRVFLLVLGLCLIIVSGLLVLTVAAVEPGERNIVYVHVPAAVCSLVSFTALFICSIQYLRTKKQKWDQIATACAEIGLLLATIMNITGMIFAKVEWGTWWTPSPRLISSVILWFLYAAYLLLRSSLDSEQRKERICAVFGIIAFIDVPVVLISARLTPDIHQPGFTFDSVWQYAAFGLAVLGTLILTMVLVWIRNEMLQRK